jgi:hypothetical protein
LNGIIVITLKNRKKEESIGRSRRRKEKDQNSIEPTPLYCTDHDYYIQPIH